MPMVPLCMSSRQPHPTRYEAKPPSSHVPMQHQSFAKPPSIHPSMPATSLPINQLSYVPNAIQLNKHLPPSAPKKRSRLSSSSNSWSQSTHGSRSSGGVHHVNQETPATSAHTLTLGASTIPYKGPCTGVEAEHTQAHGPPTGCGALILEFRWRVPQK